MEKRMKQSHEAWRFPSPRMLLSACKIIAIKTMWGVAGMWPFRRKYMMWRTEREIDCGFYSQSMLTTGRSDDNDSYPHREDLPCAKCACTASHKVSSCYYVATAALRGNDFPCRRATCLACGARSLCDFVPGVYMGIWEPSFKCPQCYAIHADRESAFTEFTVFAARDGRVFVVCFNCDVATEIH